MAALTSTRTTPKSISQNYFGTTDPEDQFKLDGRFLAKFARCKPKFGYNGLGEFVFYRTYSRVLPDGRKESFPETLKRVVEGCYEIQRRHCTRIHVPWDYNKAQASAQEMFQLMWDFKFLPPGRGLWMMGTEFMWERGSASLNNCFRGDTEIITRDGIKPIGPLVGTTQELLTKGGKWVQAPIKSFGQQEIWKLTLERSGFQKIIYTTADHRWFARDRRYPEIDVQCIIEQANICQAYTLGQTDQQVLVPPRVRTSAFQEFPTDQLRPGVHCLQYVFGQGIKGNVHPSPFGIAHGIAFGDGTTGQDAASCGTYLYLCGQKNEELLQYFPNCPATPDSSKGREGAIRVADLPRFFRQAPSLRESKSYLYGWLAGYFAADGKINPKGNSPKLSSSERKNLEVARDVCAVLGIGTYSITGYWHKVRHADGRITRHYGYDMVLMTSHLEPEFFLLQEHRRRFEHWSSNRERLIYKWRVKSVEPTGEMAEVFCPQVPETHSFALADNILTGNCGFCSTTDIANDPAGPFCFLMDMSMLGVGIGFDTKGADSLAINYPGRGEWTFTIPDSREGWVESLRLLVLSYTQNAGEGQVRYNYSKIRQAGEPIKGFGGQASGPRTLQQLHEEFRELLDRNVGRLLSSVGITDGMNLIGKCIVAGNVRRTAEIAFGETTDTAYCEMKNPTVTLLPEDMDAWHAVTGWLWTQSEQLGGIPPKATPADFRADTVLLHCAPSLNGSADSIRSLDAQTSTIPLERLLPAIDTFNNLVSHRWASNNSIYSKVGMNYDAPARSIAVNGEPGIIWLQNVQDYGRMMDGPQPGIDGAAMGANPCFGGDMRLFTETGHTNMRNAWMAGGCQEYTGQPAILQQTQAAVLGRYGVQTVVNKHGLVTASKVYRTSVDAELWRVTLQDGSHLDTTATHQYITVQRRRSHGKSVYTETRKPLSELRVGDMVPNNQQSQFGTVHEPEYSEAAGWCIGDGSLSPKADGQVRATCNCYETDVQTVLPKLQSLLHVIYQRHNRSSQQNPQYAGWEREQEHFEHDETIIGSNVLGRMMVEDCVVPGDKHRVPARVWAGNRETVAAFIRGLASADGGAQPNYSKRDISVRIGQSHQQLLVDVKLLLNQFGIQSAIRFRANAGKRLMNDGKGGKKSYDCKPRWELIVSGRKQVSAFIEQIGFIQPWKNELATLWLENHSGSNNSDTGRYTKVVSIEYLGRGETFCLTEPGHNEVVVEGHRIGQCMEQSLESYELCCLVETFPANHDNADDYMRTLKFAYLYAKTVTLLPTHNARTNSVMQRNRRIGLSQSGIVQAFHKFGRRQVLQNFCNRGYKIVRMWDDIYSKWLCVTKSIKVTSVKPSGTVSLVVGATPGVHYPEAETYWRRVRVAKHSTLVQVLVSAGYHVEPDLKDPERTVVVRFGIDDRRVSSVDKISIWEQMANAADYQHYWADNQVSCTVKFRPQEAGQIANVLEVFEDRLKGISFLPWTAHGYMQAPYEPCTPEEIATYNAGIGELDFTQYLNEDAIGSKYCDGDSCALL